MLSHGAGTLRVVILLDKSGSINSEVKLKTEKLIAGELIRSLPETTQFALVAFGSRVLETLEFGHSRAEILSAIDRLTSSPGEGETALFDALLHSSDLLGPAQIGDSVVVLSDGQDNRSKASFATVQLAYWSKGIRMFLVEFIDNYFQTREEKSGEEDSAELSIGTGGMVRRIARPEAGEILSATREIEDALSNYYLVQVGLPQSGREAISLQLELMDSSGRRRKDVRLSFPQKHLPCAMLAHP